MGNLLTSILRKLDHQIGLNSSTLSRKTFRKIVPKEKAITLLDIGAHVGEFSGECRKLNPRIRIIAVEPQVSCHQKLIESCGPEAIILEELLSSSVKEVNFLISQNRDRKGRITLLEGSGKSRALLRTTNTIDNILAKYQIDYVDILKIDTEGHDFEVLKGARDSLANNKIGLVIFEITYRLSEYGQSPKDIEMFLRSFNYGFFYRSTPRFRPILLEKLNPFELHTQNILVSKYPLFLKRHKVWK